MKDKTDRHAWAVAAWEEVRIRCESGIIALLRLRASACYQPDDASATCLAWRRQFIPHARTLGDAELAAGFRTLLRAPPDGARGRNGR